MRRGRQRGGAGDRPGDGGALVALAAVALLAACAPPPRAEEAAGGPGAPPAARVAATTPALAWLVERIGGEAVTVETLDPPALDPSWTPSAEEVLRLSAADLIVTRGRRIETWIETTGLPPSRLVETTEGLELIEREGATHSHGGEGEHSHRVADPATPLDPGLFASQARSVRDALERAVSSAGPSVGAGVRRGGDELADELEGLAADFALIGAELARRGVEACVAPAGRLDYACRALELPATGGGGATPARTLVLWPLGVPDPPMASDTVVVPIDPLERPRDDGAGGREDFDYLGRQRANLDRLRAGLGAQP